MSKAEAKRCRKKPSKATSVVVKEEDNTTSIKEIARAEEGKDVGMNQAMEEAGDKEDSQMDTVIQVKGTTTTVTVSWEKKNEEQEGDDAEKKTNTSDQMTDVDAPSESTETKMEDVEDKKVAGKRKAESAAETCPSKKTKLINDGFCLFVGNLNTSKKFEEVKNSLASYFMTQSLLVQDIRLDRSKKHAFVDLASEMDLTKALTLNGEMILDKPMKIAKAKVKSVEEVKVKVKAPPVDQKAAKDARCLFLKNIPYEATKTDILQVFPNAVAVRFPGGTKGPDAGIAFLEFKNKAIADKEKQQKQGIKIQDRVLIVDCVGETNKSDISKANVNSSNKKAAASPNTTLFVSNLSKKVKEKNLKEIFQTAVTISIPKSKSTGFAFVKFATVEDAEKALQSSKNTEIHKRKVKVQFSQGREKPEETKILPKTLIVMGLAKKTTAETLKGAFEGALTARVNVDKEAGVSKGFGFVEFESEENCKAAIKAMEDCEIDGSKVTVAFAKQKRESGRPGARGRPGGQSAGRDGTGDRRGGHKGGKGNRGGKRCGAGKPKDGVEGAVKTSADLSLT